MSLIAQIDRQLMARRAALRSADGQVALETLLVLAPWLVITFMFFNLLFLLGSLMLNQATVNRGAQQIASLGCLPQSLHDELESRAALGMTDLEVEAIAPNLGNDGRPIVNWDRNRYIDEEGNIAISPGVAKRIPTCTLSAATGRPTTTLPSGNFIFVQARYNQHLILLLPVKLAGGESSIPIHRDALVVSNSLEGEG